MRTNDKKYKPVTKLPEHLEGFAKKSQELRLKMTTVLKEATDLTDLMALRSAALPETQ